MGFDQPILLELGQHGAPAWRVGCGVMGKEGVSAQNLNRTPGGEIRLSGRMRRGARVGKPRWVRILTIPVGAGMSIDTEGIGIIKGLFVWTGQYQRPR